MFKIRHNTNPIYEISLYCQQRRKTLRESVCLTERPIMFHYDLPREKHSIYPIVKLLSVREPDDRISYNYQLIIRLFETAINNKPTNCHFIIIDMQQCHLLKINNCFVSIFDTNPSLQTFFTQHFISNLAMLNNWFTYE